LVSATSEFNNLSGIQLSAYQERNQNYRTTCIISTAAVLIFSTQIFQVVSYG